MERTDVRTTGAVRRRCQQLPLLPPKNVTLVQKNVGLLLYYYIKELLAKFQHPLPPRRQNDPHPWNVPMYGQQVQYAAAANNSPSPAEKRYPRPKNCWVAALLRHCRRPNDAHSSGIHRFLGSDCHRKNVQRMPLDSELRSFESRGYDTIRQEWHDALRAIRRFLLVGAKSP